MASDKLELINVKTFQFKWNQLISRAFISWNYLVDFHLHSIVRFAKIWIAYAHVIAVYQIRSIVHPINSTKASHVAFHWKKRHHFERISAKNWWIELFFYLSRNTQCTLCSVFIWKGLGMRVYGNSHHIYRVKFIEVESDSVWMPFH